MKNLLYLLGLVFIFSSCEKDEDEPSNNSSGPDTPISLQLESIFMTGFDETDPNGNYWDSSTNPPDPYVEVFKSGALVFTSQSIGNADHNATYPMNTATSGALPITYTPNEPLRIVVKEPDSATETQYMGQIDIADAMNFFYNGDEADEFMDVAISTSNGSVNFQVSGSFNY